MQDLENQLERLKKASGVESDTAFAQFLGISQGSISGAKKKGQLPHSWFFQVAEKTGASTDWLFFGRGEIPGVAPSEDEKKTDVFLNILGKKTQNGALIDCDDCQILMLPMVEARLSAGNGSFETSGNSERRYAFRMDFLMRKGQPASMVLMRVAGDSMEPEVHHNDVVLIDQSQRTPRPGGLYAVGVEDLVYLKVVNAAPGKLILTSYNAAYPPMEVDARGDLEDGIRIIGKAVWIGRELT
ncbi:MAG TPA: S24 family peptidase [Nitratidesulfovibrio sp.]|nr:S24 family peptidase [Nitratidesulfovibrio sp.]